MASVDFMKTTFSILMINIYFLPLTKTMYNKMKNKKYHSVGTILKYHIVGTVLKYHTVGTILKYHTVRTIPKSKIKIAYRGKNRYL